MGSFQLAVLNSKLSQSVTAADQFGKETRSRGARGVAPRTSQSRRLMRGGSGGISLRNFVSVSLDLIVNDWLSLSPQQGTKELCHDGDDDDDDDSDDDFAPPFSDPPIGRLRAKLSEQERLLKT